MKKKLVVMIITMILKKYMNRYAFSIGKICDRKKTFGNVRPLVGHSLIPVAETSTVGVGEGTIGVGGDGGNNGGNNGGNKGSLVAVGHTIAVKILRQIKYVL